MASTSAEEGTSPLVDQEAIPEIFRMQSLRAHELNEITVDRLQWLYREGKLTSVEYTTFCLQRIQRIDKYLECVMEINPDAIAIAESLDLERKRGHVRSNLHGVTVLVKDNIATKDRMETTAGSWSLLGSKVPCDATVVSKLRAAGAVIIGHANMSEWASVRSKKYSTGYSPRRGQTRNPFDLSKSPFGSSSGSAVAVSANIVPLSFGTETDTSIIGPAKANGVVGIKPTVGLTSRYGVIPISENMDTVGSFGRTVADAVLGLDIIAGEDEQDSKTMESGRVRQDYASFLSTCDALKGATFGLPQKRCWEALPPEDKKILQRVLEAISENGATIVNTDFPSAEERFAKDGRWNWEHGDASTSEFTVVKTDAYNGINAYLSQLSETPIRSLEDVVEYNRANRGTEGANPGDHPAFPTGQDNLEEIVRHKGARDETYHQALRHIQKQTRTNGIDAALQHTDSSGKHISLDALLLLDRKGAGQQMAAQAGYPIITIPIGLDGNGLPLGLSLQHTAWREDALIKWASAIEDMLNKQSGWRATPKFRNYMAKNIPIDPIAGGNHNYSIAQLEVQSIR